MSETADALRIIRQLDGEIAALKAASRWQPIDTAPKDGTHVLLYWPYWNSDPIVGWFKFGRWDSVMQSSTDGEGPTHWMPLPAPPGAQTGAAK